MTQTEARRAAGLLQEQGIECIANTYGQGYEPREKWGVFLIGDGSDITETAENTLAKEGQ